MEQLHDDQRADDRKGQSGGCDKGFAEAPKTEKDHCEDEGKGDDERPLDIFDRLFNPVRLVKPKLELHRRREVRLLDRVRSF